MKTLSFSSLSISSVYRLPRAARVARRITVSLAVGAMFTLVALAPRSPLVATAHAAETTAPAGPDTRPEIVKRGEYLARAGDCVACHTAPRGKTFGGGLAMETPFGTFFTPNISSDKEYGIGKWTADEFFKMMRTGKSPDGKLI
ncbi:MAG: cytochrome c, partial [Paraburkholderia hospita]